MDDNSPPCEAILSLVKDRDVLPQCFATSGELHRMIMCMLDRLLSLDCTVLDTKTPSSTVNSDKNGAVSHVALKGPTTRPPSNIAKSGDNSPASTQQVVAKHLRIEWPNLAAALREIRRAPTVLSADERRRTAFLAHFARASAIMQADSWQPLPASVDEWSWPPAPLVPLRAACKIAQSLGPDTVRAMWPVLAGAMTSVLIRMVEAVRADIERAVDLLTTVFERERRSSLDTYFKQLRRARRDPTFPEFQESANELKKQLRLLHRKDFRVQTTTSFPKLFAAAYAAHARYNKFLALLAQKCGSLLCGRLRLYYLDR